MKYVLVIIFLAGALSPVSAQDNLLKMAKAMYRVDPFAGTFSAFVETLISDTALHKKQILKQTDSTGYYVRGEYNIFNPFRINADRVDMIFYENTIETAGRIPLNYYTYQITAYFPDTDLTRREIKKDFSKLVRNFRRDLYYTNDFDLKGHKGIEDGKIVSLTDNRFYIEPAVISWQTLSKTKQLGLTILLRVKHVKNKVYPVNSPAW